MTCYSLLGGAKIVLFNVEDKIKGFLKNCSTNGLIVEFDSFLALDDFVHLFRERN